jgi:hypothetical protein
LEAVIVPPIDAYHREIQRGSLKKPLSNRTRSGAESPDI